MQKKSPSPRTLQSSLEFVGRKNLSPTTKPSRVIVVWRTNHPNGFTPLIDNKPTKLDFEETQWAYLTKIKELTNTNMKDEDLLEKFLIAN